MKPKRPSIELDRLLQATGQTGQRIPPLEKWQPELSGDMDLHILRDGRWIHEGIEIKRASLIRLFSHILWREGDEYFLKTPREKFRIQVEDVPFHVTSLKLSGEPDQPVLRFTTLTGDVVDADQNHPIQVVYDPISGLPSPYLFIRFGMQGLISRSVYLELAERSREEVRHGVRRWLVNSGGSSFELGRE